MNPLQEQFVAESRELIQQATDDLIALERDGFAAERVDRVFRAFHTLKGSAGVVELPAMALALHAAEDVLAAIRESRVQAGSALVSDVLECLDRVAQWVNAFEAHGGLPLSAGDEGRLLAERLRSHLGRNMTGTRASQDEGLPDWVSRLIEAQHHDALPGAEPLFAISYQPHAACFLDGDDPLSLVRRVPKLLALRLELSGEQPPLAEFDPFSCHMRLYALAAGPRDALSAVFRLVPDQVRILDVPPVVPPEPLSDGQGAAMLVRAIVAEQVQVLHAGGAGDEDLAGRIGAATRTVANALRHLGREATADQVARAGAAALAQRNAGPLLAVLDDTLDLPLPTLPGEGEAVGSVRGDRAEPVEGAGGRWLRVDETRVDALVNLAGELIVLKSRFAHLARRIEDEAGRPDLSRALRREHEAVERLASDLHGAIVQLRMVPIAHVLRAFPRVVRDLAQRLDKKVRLITSGDTTECDKAVADRLFEPLLHLVRNALDHGVESDQARRAAGKEPTGTVTLRASRVGDRIVLEVSDDGRGIDPAVIRRKAAERGLLDDATLAALPDEQVLDLIFSTGFSTAGQVSDISGRGVGMDVVRTTVDQIGGRVSLTSRLGAGTTVRLDVPVNIATSRIMVIECAGQSFGIPMDAVTETVRLSSDRIQRVKNNEGVVLRDRVVPICSLAELMNLPGERAPEQDGRLVLVIEAGGRLTAVEIDAIRDRLDVVLKPMQGVLANASGYAGTTMLGDGAVLLVLDVKELLP
jgi:two-component system, chemotaxis family, sensor kinase CheA